jgi:sporulation protein YlmC with PRC-barrel domain
MRINRLFMAAALALGTGALYAADVEVKANANANSNPPKVEAEVKGDAARPREYKQEARIETAVKPINRAHNIIGMEVRNRNDEKLGEVKDLVLDLQSGKVSYAALAVGGFLGVGEKLIAIPTGALTPSSNNEKVLILDATRGEVVDAPGFASTNWPDPRSPELNDSPLWRKNRGGAPSAETGKAKLYTDANKERASVDVKTDRDNTRSHTAVGRVKTINPKTIEIDTNNGRAESFAVGDRSVQLSDFQVGQHVTVKYHTDNSGRMVIESLSRQ